VVPTQILAIGFKSLQGVAAILMLVMGVRHEIPFHGQERQAL
jgi:hypothetical protein